MALKTAMVSCARCQDSFLSASVRRVHIVFLTAGFQGEGKPSIDKKDYKTVFKYLRHWILEFIGV